MTMARRSLSQRPRASAERVEELVARVRTGQVRVPRFQTGLRWKAIDVLRLFTSLHRGYPVGSLLFYKDRAAGSRISIGPLKVDAPDLMEAWWVVDGQQRVTALTAGLGRSLPLPTRPSADDPYVVYFDAERQVFEAPPSAGGIPDHWVPVPSLLDATVLSEWVHHWRHSTNSELRRIVFEAGSRLREYSIPLYLLDEKDPQVLKEIFYSVNRYGQPLQWTDVHKALFGSDEEEPSTLAQLADELTQLGMGRMPEERLLTGLLALRGLDPTRTLGEHRDREPDVLREAVGEALPVIRRALSFLQVDAGIPHLRLFPQSTLMDVLIRFFAQHAAPNPRTRLLLARWFWRTVLGAGVFDERTLRRRGIHAVVGNEEDSVQALLGLVRRDRPRAFELPEIFDPRADQSRVALLALCSRGPRDLATGLAIEIGVLAERKSNFLPIFTRSTSPLGRGPANRLIHPKGPLYRLLCDRIRVYGPDDPVVASHAINRRAAEFLVQGAEQEFLAERAALLTEEIARFCEQKAEWDHTDRPSLDYLLSGTEVGG